MLSFEIRHCPMERTRYQAAGELAENNRDGGRILGSATGHFRSCWVVVCVVYFRG
jgi:hypothetical protein